MLHTTSLTLAAVQHTNPGCALRVYRVLHIGTLTQRQHVLCTQYQHIRFNPSSPSTIILVTPIRAAHATFAISVSLAVK